MAVVGIAGRYGAMVLPGGLLLAAAAGLGATGAARAQAQTLPSNCQQSGQSVTCTFATGSNAFVVPAGVTSIHVTAIGGIGGPGNGFPSAAGARVTGPLPVSTNETLYAVVGGNGSYNPPVQVPGGDNGGSGGTSGGGGSDIRTSQFDLMTRLLVAGGGGGYGWPGYLYSQAGTSFCGTGGAGGTGGGNGGQTGTRATSCPTGPDVPSPGGLGGGGAGGGSAGGVGGGGGTSPCSPPVPPVCTGGTDGASGGLGTGGNAGSGGGGSGGGGTYQERGGDGGGGGGGWYGGGGGGGGGVLAPGGGGGGGSNLVPPSGTQTVDTKGVPMVQITYTLPSSSGGLYEPAPVPRLSPQGH